MRFLLTCDCGKQMEVTAAMAGTTVSCTCQRQVEIPSLKALREQHPDGHDTNNTIVPVQFSMWKLVLFVLIGLWLFGFFFPILLRIGFR
jgi:hypothetical protein